jgi:hypothetical protein
MARAYIFLLALSALSISVVGAFFSVSGLMKMFAGAPLAVMAMAGTLEFAKVVTAGFIHQTWDDINKTLRLYLTTAVIVLVAITSLGIFGYLTQAYQETAQKLKAVELDLKYRNQDQMKIESESARLISDLNLIPGNRVSKRLEMQKQIDPELKRMREQLADLSQKIRELDLQKLEFESKIGPLIYVAKFFNKDSGAVAQFFILIFVMVFDPLAVCLVLATSYAVKRRRAEVEGKGSKKAA